MNRSGPLGAAFHPDGPIGLVLGAEVSVVYVGVQAGYGRVFGPDDLQTGFGELGLLRKWPLGLHQPRKTAEPEGERRASAALGSASLS